jgi:low temperature requirement protein LtrA
MMSGGAGPLQVLARTLNLKGMAFHRILPMTGRNPHEEHRVSTPLELLFDLTFVVAFGIAGNEMAHILAEGHFGTALAAYAFVMFGVCWAWINYSWFASAYATDDWLFRLLTMAQMVGVVIFALGLPDVFKSMDEGNILDNRVVVFGYMIMRLPVVALWLRAARHDAARRPTALTYVKTLLAAQALWTVIMIVDLPIAATFAAMSVPFAIELLGPYLAERKGGTPWHPHHIAERYGLLTIIALGEGVIGTVASVSALVEEAGWNLDAILVASAGIGLTFALWWIYFVVPSGEFLHRHRERSGGSRHCRNGRRPARGGALHRGQEPHRPGGDTALRGRSCGALYRGPVCHLLAAGAGH